MDELKMYREKACCNGQGQTLKNCQQMTSKSYRECLDMDRSKLFLSHPRLLLSKG